jgi:hypothetical protein
VLDPQRPPGGVPATLRALRGVWAERVTGYAVDGTELTDDPMAARPGPLPFEQLVYFDFDDATGEYRQTNVVTGGREPHERTFRGRVADGRLQFRLPAGAPDIVGVSAGPDTVIFTPARLDGPAARYAEPDWVRLLGPDRRTRSTALYRDGVLIRTLTGEAVRLSTDPTVRVPTDPRGPVGPIHTGDSATTVYDRPRPTPPPASAEEAS